jgi:NAD(P)-dependent dehydrogenase (short-subunit alcohol dehydrogenase family)/acyl carrier protein
VLALEEAGAEVLAVAADIADPVQMERAVAAARERFGALNGVLHLAGVPAEGLIQRKTLEATRRVFAPKIGGALALAQALAGEDLDFCVLFSSITSVTGGGPGQIDYCAANAFLDAWAQAAARQRCRTVAIDWGEWQWNAWDEGLAGFDPAVQELFRQNRREFGIHFAEGEEALRRILASRLTRCIVSTQDFNALLDAGKELTVASILDRIQEARRAESIHPRPILGTSFAAPRDDSERRIAVVWADMLRLEEVGIHDNFFELGGNSLMGIQLIGNLREVCRAEIPSYALYEAPTVADLAVLIAPGAGGGEGLIADRRSRGELRRQQQQRRRDQRAERQEGS